MTNWPTNKAMESKQWIVVMCLHNDHCIQDCIHISYFAQGVQNQFDIYLNFITAWNIWSEQQFNDQIPIFTQEYRVERI